MPARFFKLLATRAVCAWLLGWGQMPASQDSPQPATARAENPQATSRVPAGVILIHGAWSSAWSSAGSSAIPLPEDARIASHTFRDPYFGITWPLPAGWKGDYQGPPPSDEGRYVLAQMAPSATFQGQARGSILITADDLFFAPWPAKSALAFVENAKQNLDANGRSDYKVERAPEGVTIGGRPFAFFAYWSPAAKLHWSVFVTVIRCHVVEIVFSSSDTRLIANLIQDMNAMEWPADDDGGAFPVCVQDYAKGENLIARVDPVFPEQRFNAVPVRIVIGRDGRVIHIHFLSAFPDQAKAITDALEQWRFKPYMQNGQPVEVETGMLFGYTPRAPAAR
jgi:hypothetical protein